MITDRLLYGTNVPVQFKGSTFADYDIDRGDPRIIKDIEGWEPTEARPNLLLVGRPGLAKTMLACATLNEFKRRFGGRVRNAVNEEAQRFIAQEKYPVYFVQLAEFIKMHIRVFKMHQDVHSGLRDPQEYLETDQLLQDLEYRVKMLVVDDVGKEHRTATGFAEDAFDLLVRNRHNRGLPTIFTSNVPLDQWSNQYSESMQNLIHRSSLVLKFR